MSSLRFLRRRYPIPHAWGRPGARWGSPPRFGSRALRGQALLLPHQRHAGGAPDIYEESRAGSRRRREYRRPASSSARRTHHAPSTLLTISAYGATDFCASLQETLVRAALDALRLDSSPEQRAAAFSSQKDQEASTVGMKLRYLLKDGTIACTPPPGRRDLPHRTAADPGSPLCSPRLPPRARPRAVRSAIRCITSARYRTKPTPREPTAWPLRSWSASTRRDAFLPGGLSARALRAGLALRRFLCPDHPSGFTALWEAVKEGLGRAVAVDVDAIQALRRPSPIASAPLMNPKKGRHGAALGRASA